MLARIDHAIRSDPFSPFVIYLTDGKYCFEIARLDQVVICPDGGGQVIQIDDDEGFHMVAVQAVAYVTFAAPSLPRRQ